jgi:hypothetical protein
MAQTQAFEIGFYSVPDPAWDYSTLWGWLHKSQGELGNLLTYTAQFEEAIGIQLEAIATNILSRRQLTLCSFFRHP